ncbi:MAG: hypothetical protein R2697_01195 [Ilumatobacteraceae bacterium]
MEMCTPAALRCAGSLSAVGEITIESTPFNWRRRFFTVAGSSVLLRSRRTSMSTEPTSVITNLERVPSQEFPQLQGAEPWFV